MKKFLYLVSTIVVLLLGGMAFAVPAHAAPAEITNKRFCGFVDSSHIICKVANGPAAHLVGAKDTALSASLEAVLPIAGNLSKYATSQAQSTTGEVNNIYDWEPPTTLCNLMGVVVGAACRVWSVEDLYYNPVASKDAKKPVYGDATDPGHTITLANDLNTFSFGGDDSKTNIGILAHPDKSSKPGENRDYCSMLNQNSGCAINSAQNKGTFDGKDPLDTKPFLKQLDLAQQDVEQYKQCEDSGLGPVSSYICPTLFWIKNAFTKLVSPEFGVTILDQFFQISGVKAGSPLQAMNNGLLVIADVAFIIIFLVIILANTFTLGIDNYTIKRTLPRLIAAIILAQFSFFICAILVDLTNVIGNFMYDFIYGLARTGLTPSADPKSLFVMLQNQGLFVEFFRPLNNILTASGANSFFTGSLVAIGVIIGGLIFLAGVIAFLISLVIFLARFLLIYVLIIIAPLAFVAWVLPGTEKYFKIWWSNFLKLLIMYPIVMIIFATAGVLSTVLFYQVPDDGSVSSIIQKYMAALIPIIALFMVPKAFKWGGNIMNSVGSAIGSYVGTRAGQAKNIGKQVGGTAKNSGQDKIAESKFGESKTGKFLAGGGVGAFAGTRGSERKVQGRIAKIRHEREGEMQIAYGKYKAATAPLDDEKNLLKSQGVPEGDLRFKDIERRQAAAVANLVKTTGGNKSAQLALMKSAGVANDGSVLNDLRAQMTRADWVEGVSANYSAFDKIPLARNFTSAEAQTELAGYNTNSFLEMSQKSQEVTAKDADLAPYIPATVYTQATAEQRTKFSTKANAVVGARIHAKDAAGNYVNNSASDQQIRTVIDASGQWIGTPSGSSGPAAAPTGPTPGQQLYVPTPGGPGGAGGAGGAGGGGTQGPSGGAGPQGPGGAPGFNPTTQRNPFNVPGSSGGQTSASGLWTPGTAGAPGPTGPAGSTPPTPAPGPTGPSGPAGAPGPTGPAAPTPPFYQPGGSTTPPGSRGPSFRPPEKKEPPFRNGP